MRQLIREDYRHQTNLHLRKNNDTILHMPYRAWCPLCVQCKGRADYHKRQVFDKKPVIQLDYAFITSKPKTTDDEPNTTTVLPQDKNTVTMLTAVDVTTGMSASSIVKNKGPNDYAVNEVIRFVLEVGRSQGVLQTDQEPAIRALAREAATKLGMTTRLAPAYSHRSQGSVERWHKELHGHVKLLREMIKINYQVDLTPTSPMMTWVVKQPSWLHTRYQIHTDGKTSYERRWGIH